MKKILHRLKVSYGLLFFSLLSLIVNIAQAQSASFNCNEPTPWTTSVTSNLKFDASYCGGSSQATCTGEVIDADLVNNWQYLNTGLLGSGHMSVYDDVNTYPASTTDPYYVGFNYSRSSLLNLDLLGILNNVTISTYNNGSLVQTQAGTSLSIIGVSLLSQTRVTAGFVATQPFDEVRIAFGTGLLTTYNVYYPVLQKFCNATEIEPGQFLACNTPTFQSVPESPLYVDSKNLGASGVINVNGSVTNADYAIDDDTATFAQMSNDLGVLGSVTLPVVNALDEYPANTFAGFVIEKASVISVDVLDQLTISTYNNGSFVQSESGASGLVDVGLGLLYGQTGKQTVGFVCTQPFDEVRITLAGVASAITIVNVHALVTTRTCATTLQCTEAYYLTNPATPAFVNFQKTGVGTACVGCQIENADYVTNSDTSDAAELVLTAALLGSISLSVQDPSNTFPAGSLAGFVIESSTSGVLLLDVLANLTLSTYLDGVLQETKSAGNLLDLELLGLLGNQQGGKSAVGFYTSADFDEIQISYGGLVSASLLTELKVYYAFAETSLASDGGSLICCPTIARPTGFPAERWVYMSQILDDLQIESTIETPSGISWMLYSEQQTGADMYTGGVKIAESTVDGTTQTTLTQPLRDYFSPFGTYYIYGISTGLPADPSCRPFAEFILHVQMTKSDVITGNTNSIITGDVSINDVMLATTTYSNAQADAGNPSSAALSLNADGTYSFSTTTSGVYTFMMDVCEASITPVACKKEVLKILIREPRILVNGPFAADDYALVIGGESSPTNTVTIPILKNDAPRNTGGSLGTPTIATAAQNGTATIVNGELEYAPDLGFYGTDTVVYQVCETPSGLCTPAQVVISVAQPISSIAVIASDDISVSKKGESISVAAADGLMVNDFTTGTGVFSVSGETAVIPDVGTLVIGVDGSYTFTPDPDFVGSYSHPYSVCENGICDEGNLLLVVEDFLMLWDIKLFLEGAFDATVGSMSTHLSAGGTSSILATNALEQPFNVAPWNYTGAESVTADFFVTHTDITDWVLIQLRDPLDPTVVLYQKACFITATGDALDVSGYDGIQVSAPEGSFYVSVVHRNHANVASLSAIDAQSGLAIWDIRTDNSNVYTTGGNPRGVKEIVNGGDTYYALYGGDCDNNQNINSTDRGSISTDFFKSGYYLGDTYLDGTVNSVDRTIISRNFFYSISFY